VTRARSFPPPLPVPTNGPLVCLCLVRTETVSVLHRSVYDHLEMVTLSMLDNYREALLGRRHFHGCCVRRVLPGDQMNVLRVHAAAMRKVHCMIITRAAPRCTISTYQSASDGVSLQYWRCYMRTPYICAEFLLLLWLPLSLLQIVPLILFLRSDMYTTVPKA